MGIKEMFAYLFYGAYLRLRDKGRADPVPFWTTTYMLVLQISGLMAFVLLIPISAIELYIGLNRLPAFFDYTGPATILVCVGLGFYLLWLNDGGKEIIRVHEGAPSVDPIKAKLAAKRFFNTTTIVGLTTIFLCVVYLLFS